MPRKRASDVQKAILNSNENEMYVVDFDDDIFFDFIRVTHLTENQVQIQIEMTRDNCLVDDINSMREKPGNATKLYDAIGVSDEFKLLFYQLKSSTKYSKKEISNILRNDAVCESGRMLLVFKNIISANKIKN